MAQKKVLTIVGARPQFIKSAPVSVALKMPGNIKEVLVHTGQHYDKNMSEVFFEELKITPPAYSLGIGSASGPVQTGRMMEALDAVLTTEKPDLVLVYGDTNSTLAGALTASKHHIPVIHIEAGLRSYNRQMPEEVNRVLTDHLSSLLFCPTKNSVRNLQKEGITEGVRHVGDVMYDAALHFGKIAESKSSILHELQLKPKKFILATIHRAENTQNPACLGQIMQSLAQIALQREVVFPVHPGTLKAIKDLSLSPLLEKINHIDPVGYLDMCMLQSNASLIITDSGGIQKEAYFHKVPCLTLRTETEWIETVESGWNILADPGKSEDILAKMDRIRGPGKIIDDFGEGNSCSYIASELKNFIQ